MQNARILIVDDFKSTTELLRTILEDAEYRTDVAFNGTEAIKLFKEAIDNEPDYPDAYFELGKIYLLKQKQAETNTTISNINYLSTVKRYFKKVIELCPTYNIYCYYTLGDIYLRFSLLLYE